MVEALEERALKEVIDRDGAIEALKKEVELLKTKRAWFSGEVENLRDAQSDAAEVSYLSKARCPL